MSMIDYWDMYNTCPTFKTYVDKYAKTHRLLPENAVKCMIVKQYAEYLKGGGGR